MVRLSFDDQLLAEDDFAQLRPKRRKSRRWGARRRAKSCCCFPLVFLLILFGILVTAIIAKTINGKGLPAIENTLLSHYYVLDDKTYQEALEMYREDARPD